MILIYKLSSALPINFIYKYKYWHQNLNFIGTGASTNLYFVVLDIEVIIQESCSVIADTIAEPSLGDQCICRSGYYKNLDENCNYSGIKYFKNSFCGSCFACPLYCEKCSSMDRCETCIGNYTLINNTCVLKNGTI